MPLFRSCTNEESTDELSNPLIQEITPKLIPVFEEALGPPEEQLELETRELIKKMVRLLYGVKPELFQNNPGLIDLVN